MKLSVNMHGKIDASKFAWQSVSAAPELAGQDSLVLASNKDWQRRAAQLFG